MLELETLEAKIRFLTAERSWHAHSISITLQRFEQMKKIALKTADTEIHYSFAFQSKYQILVCFDQFN